MITWPVGGVAVNTTVLFVSPIFVTSPPDMVIELNVVALVNTEFVIVTGGATGTTISDSPPDISPSTVLNT
jgi:hypothetical protein